MPSKSLRAVLTTPERMTFGGIAEASSSTSTWRAPLGCSIESRDPLAEHGEVVPHRAGDHDRGADADRAKYPDGLVHPDGDERPRADRAGAGGRRDQGDLRHRRAADVAEAHRLARFEPQFLNALVQLFVALKLGDRLLPRLAEAGGGDHDDRHAVVHAGHRNAAEDIGDVSRREHACGGARVLEVEHDRRRGARHPVDRGVPVIAGPSARGGERGGDDPVGVHHPDPDARLVIAGGHQAALDRERPDAGQDVAAVLLVGDDRLVDHDLQEQVIDVDAGQPGRCDDRDLGRQRVRPADPVDLPRVGRPHDPQQQVIPLAGIGGEVVGQEVQPLGRPAPHLHGPDPVTRRHAPVRDDHSFRHPRPRAARTRRS